MPAPDIECDSVHFLLRLEQLNVLRVHLFQRFAQKPGVCDHFLNQLAYLQASSLQYGIARRAIVEQGNCNCPASTPIDLPNASIWHYPVAHFLHEQLPAPLLAAHLHDR